MTIPALNIGGLSIPTPIIQGGMGIGVSLAGLAAAVANAGGCGVISAAGVGNAEADFKSNFVEANSRALAEQIRKARAATSGVLGVNIMVALTNFAETVKTAVREKIDIIFSGAGLPLDLPSHVPDENGPRLVPIVSSARAAALICRKWIANYNRCPDAIVVEGPMAGGHLGFKPKQLDDEEYALEKLVPQVVEAARPFAEQVGRDIPIIAAGGVYTGADIHKYFQLGASGVQLGTRFVATHECDADIAFKNAYINASEHDVQIISSPLGMPGRAIRNTFVEHVEADGKKPYSCPYHCLKTCDYTNTPYCISVALTIAKNGRCDHGLIFAGQNVHRVNSIVSVQELMNELTDEYAAAAATD
ncbi:NAD(P)H-dependent flavin oxidoreductase [Mucisphaera calidilacus]|uniref:Nitronate monooxygenase n=1 Tax=Mucisphaera calidilacus TaxID=2527982 RepID=A0A518BXJ1_9BACT|nr:nitronate monooxygenase family protein [Mucisphaera calidilacus]QDU71674.1 Nitronate monooxygenase [Mucisphaera calidilacus]